MNDIIATCFTNLDNFKDEIWPTRFPCVPKVGDSIESKNGKQLEIVRLVWKPCYQPYAVKSIKSDHELISTLQIELHYPKELTQHIKQNTAQSSNFRKFWEEQFAADPETTPDPELVDWATADIATPKASIPTGEADDLVAWTEARLREADDDKIMRALFPNS